jgi:hypothetical protein
MRVNKRIVAGVSKTIPLGGCRRGTHNVAKQKHNQNPMPSSTQQTQNLGSGFTLLGII